MVAVPPPVVLIAGAGVIGACAAFYLARRGAQVICAERAARPATGTTAVGFATATAYQRFPRAYFDLNRAGIAEHALLARELAPATWWHPAGTVGWSCHESFAGYLDTLCTWGCPLRRYRSADAAAALPDDVRWPDRGEVVLLPDEGWLDPVAFTARVLDQAQELGASLECGVAVTTVTVADGRVREASLSDGRRFQIHALINAAGSDADEIAVMAGARPFTGRPRHSLMVRAMTGGEPLRHIIRAPGMSIRPDGPGQVVMRSDDVDRDLPAGTGPVDPSLLSAVMKRAVDLVPALDAATVIDATVVAARCPRDGLPSIGPLRAVPGYYEAVASAGVTLAPVFGQLLAAMITGGTVTTAGEFTPNRFAEEQSP
jgi:glycine/D-amino acid oxidase-like deaminating enzyme